MKVKCDYCDSYVDADGLLSCPCCTAPLGEAVRRAEEQAKQEAFKDREKALSQLQEASGKADDIVRAAVKQAKDEKASILAQADKEAAAARKKAHEQIEAERQSMYQDMQKEMVEIAMSAAGKLIGEKNAEELDRDAIDAFVKEVGSYDK